MSENAEGIESVIHEVNSKCSTLRSAAAMLKSAPRPKAEELLVLMSREAESLARAISSFQGNRGDAK